MNESRFTVVIPARYQSSRLPGKPLKLIAGKPMVRHVYDRARQSAADRVIVATDHQGIFNAVTDFGGEAVMTNPEHASGSDRIHQVVSQLNMAEDAVVVNVQGDEPLIPPAVINQVADNLYRHSLAGAATLSETIASGDDFQNPNIVKVVVDTQGYALYFSRAAIPYDQNPEENRMDVIRPQRHIGIYAYRVGLLNRFVHWPQANLEATERLEQLRLLANGEKIHVSKAQEPVPGGIDTPADLQRVRELFP